MSPDNDSPVLYDSADGIARITMNRPRYRNAQNSAMTYALDDAFSRAAGDDDVRAIVLQGAGDHFSAGHDVGSPGADHDVEFDRRATMWWNHVGKAGAEGRFAREQEVYLEMCRRWREIPKATVAKVQGACLAGALALVWACDFIVASDDAFFADAAVQFNNIGIEYFAHPWQMSPRFAKEFLLLGRRVGAAEAKSWGMVNRVVPREQLDDEVNAIASRLTEMSRFGVALAKRAINHAEDLMGLRDGIDYAFALHHLSHSYVAEIGDSFDPAKVKASFARS